MDVLAAWQSGGDDDMGTNINWLSGAYGYMAANLLGRGTVLQ
jgi:hypothetical protein